MQLIMLSETGKPVGIITGSPEEIIEYIGLVKQQNASDSLLSQLFDSIKIKPEEES